MNVDNDTPESLWEENRAFFQANLTRGGRYLDDAGKIINDYADRYGPYSVDPSGLHFAGPTDPAMPDQIAVDVNRIWIACYGPGCVKKLSEVAEDIAAAISRHIDVESYERLGLRANYFKSLQETGAYSRKLGERVYSPPYMALIGPVERVSTIAVQTGVLVGTYSVAMAIRSMKIARPARGRADFPGNGMVLDIDVSEGADREPDRRRLTRRHIGTFVRESEEHLRSWALQAIGFLADVDAEVTDVSTGN